MIIGGGDGSIPSHRLVGDDEISNPESFARSQRSQSHSYSASCHSRRNSSNVQSSSNGLMSGESNTHVVGMQRDDLKATLPVPAASADENEEDDDDDGDDILIRRSASGVFRYSSHSPAVSNTAHLCFNKSNAERLQHEEGHSHSDERYGGHGHQGGVESPEIRQRKGSSMSLRRSRHNLDPEDIGIRPMPAQEKTEGTSGNAIDMLQRAEDDGEYSQFLSNSNFKSNGNFDSGDGDSIAYQEAGLFRDDKVENDPFDDLHLQVKMSSKNMGAKLLQVEPDRVSVDTTVALTEIRSQLHELTRSVENCQSEVYEVKHDMMSIKHEIDSVQFVKDEIDDIRDSLDRLESDGERRKAKLLEQGLTFILGYSIFSAVLGMLQFGYNTGVINAPESVIEKFIRFAHRKRYNGQNMTYEASTFLYAIAVAIFALGGMAGGFTGGWIANKCGRKGGLLINNIVGILGAAAMGFAKFAESYELLIMGRFLIGVNCGLNTSLVPMYISEIAPLTLRGGLGTVNQLAVTVGLLISQILGIEGLLGTDDGWPILLGFAVLPPALQLILLPFCPESPRYLLISRQQETLARNALKRLRNSDDVEDDIAEMRAEEQAQMSESKIRMLELLRSAPLRLPLLIAIVMQLSQQLSGINAVFYYSTNLFITTGLSESHAKYATIGIGAVMVIMTLISIPLMDRSGRRTLHLYGLGGMFIFSIFITISFLVKELVSWIWWLSVVSTLFYVVFFAVGPGSIPWMITAELFSQGPRPAAMSIAVLINWCANFLVGIGFPTMQTALENYTFLPFSVFLAIFWVFTYKKVPETKNKTFDEIATLFRIGHKQRSLLNCVNSIPQMNNSVCEHKNLINPSSTKEAPQPLHPPPDDANVSVQEYPLLVDSYPSSPRSRSRSPRSPRSDKTPPSQLSDYSLHMRNSSSQIISPGHSEIDLSPHGSTSQDMREANYAVRSFTNSSETDPPVIEQF